VSERVLDLDAVRRVVEDVALEQAVGGVNRERRGAVARALSVVGVGHADHGAAALPVQQGRRGHGAAGAKVRARGKLP